MKEPQKAKCLNEKCKWVAPADQTVKDENNIDSCPKCTAPVEFI